jgi:8-oxo-dGTP pyrophosphatase MutT (NUDIX family)
MDVRYSISSYVFSFQDGEPRFLTLLRAPGFAHAGTWQAVHGMVDPGESAFRAAHRETLEETGLVPERFFRVELIEQFYGVDDDAFHIVPVFAAFVAGTPRPRLSHEHIERAVASWPETSVELLDVTACLRGS